MHYFKNQQGISIYLAIGFMGAIILLALGVSTVMTMFLRGVANVEVMNKAYFAAEGGLENALYDLSEHLPGYENFEHQDRQTFASQNNSDVAWYIKSQTPLDNEENKYVIPPRGEGTVSTGSNWNKLTIGQSRAINLFLDTSSPGTETNDCAQDSADCDILNISHPSFGFRSLQLRLRPAPDQDGNDVNLKTNDLAEESSIADDTILTWSLSGKDKDPGSNTFYSLREKEAYTQQEIAGELNIERNYDDSTEIYEQKINNHLGSDDYYVLDSSENDVISDYFSSRKVGRGVDQNKNIRSLEWFLENTNIHRPQFVINLVSKLFNSSDEIVPHLEYQILVDADQPIPNEYFTIVSHGYAGTFKQTIISKIRPKTTSGLLDFAIFQ